jgi:hypothetical protein|nr:MAG TPA: hypothetical protein [Caudoviricetes sp.]
MQFDDTTREAIEVIQSIHGIATVRLVDIFDISFNSKKDVFGRKDIVENGYPAIFFSDISRKYDVTVENIEAKISKELFEISNKMSRNDILVSLEEFDKIQSFSENKFSKIQQDQKFREFQNKTLNLWK